MNVTKEKLISSFEELFLIEKKARDLYAGKLTENLTDYEKNVIQSIHDDEKRHMEIVQEILALIKGQP